DVMLLRTARLRNDRSEALAGFDQTQLSQMAQRFADGMAANPEARDQLRFRWNSCPDRIDPGQDFSSQSTYNQLVQAIARIRPPFSAQIISPTDPSAQRRTLLP